MITDISIQKHRTNKPANPVFSILIPTWNNIDYLKLCIGSIRKNSRFAHKVIVHVNENMDGTLEWIQSQPDIDYTYSEKNIGICYAMNIARELIASEYILYMNDDMYACPGWDKELWEEIQKIGHNYFFISGTAIEPVDQSNNCVVVGDFGRDIQSFQEERLLNGFADRSMGDWQGATWPPNIVHRDIWDLAGGYSIEFSPGMYSDPDFSMKLWMMGIRLFKGLGKSRVYHFGSRSTGRVKKNNGYYRFIQKWGMTSSTLTKYYLRRGQPFDGPLQTPRISIGTKCKNLFQRLQTALKKH